MCFSLNVCLLYFHFLLLVLHFLCSDRDVMFIAYYMLLSSSSLSLCRKEWQLNTWIEWGTFYKGKLRKYVKWENLHTFATILKSTPCNITCFVCRPFPSFLLAYFATYSRSIYAINEKHKMEDFLRNLLHGFYVQSSENKYILRA